MEVADVVPLPWYESLCACQRKLTAFCSVLHQCYSLDVDVSSPSLQGASASTRAPSLWLTRIKAWLSLTLRHRLRA